MLMTIRIALLTAAVLAGGLAWAHVSGGDEPPLPSTSSADRILVRKSERTLTLYRGDRPLKTYWVAIGGGNPGPKRREGDRKTPEGLYRIEGRNPKSVAYLSLRVSYPAPGDVATAEAAAAPPGGDIMIHGLMNGWGWVGRLHRFVDWTDGCIAVTNPEMLEIWRAVPDGASIEIRP